MDKDDLSAAIRAALVAYFEGDALHQGMVPHLTDGLWPQVQRQGIVPCGTCGKPCYWVECSARGWWAHEAHPNDDHDAVPPGGLRLQAELDEAKRDLNSALLKVVDWKGKYYVRRGENVALRRQLVDAKKVSANLRHELTETREELDKTKDALRGMREATQSAVIAGAYDLFAEGDDQVMGTLPYYKRRSERLERQLKEARSELFNVQNRAYAAEREAGDRLKVEVTLRQNLNAVRKEADRVHAKLAQVVAALSGLRQEAEELEIGGYRMGLRYALDRIEGIVND